MAHKKGAGSSKNGRESHSKRLGVKIFGSLVVHLEFNNKSNCGCYQRVIIFYPGWYGITTIGFK